MLLRLGGRLASVGDRLLRRALSGEPGAARDVLATRISWFGTWLTMVLPPLCTFVTLCVWPL